MGQDIKIQNSCDHRVVKELAEFSANRFDAYLTYPIASTNSLSVYVDGIAYDKEDFEVAAKSQGFSVSSSRSIIRFMKRVKSAFPRVEVSYITYPDQCPKCQGASIIDDYSLSSDGDIRLIRDEAYAVQMVEKFIVTKLGSNKFHDWVGTSLHDLAGSKTNDLDLIKSRVRDQVRLAVSKLVEVQEKMVSSGVNLSLGEQYGSTLSIDIAESPDRSLIEVVLTFRVKSGKTIEYSQLVELEKFRKRLSQ